MACHVRVGILPIPLVCTIKVVNKEIQLTGITDTVMSSLSNTLNCSYSYHLPSMLTFGTPDQNGTWKTGLMGDLANNIVDMTLPGVARAADRDALADPTHVTVDIPVGILAGRNQTRDTNMAGYLLTFDVQVWVALLLFLPLLSIALAFLDVVSRRIRGTRTAAFESWNEHFWMLFENMLCEASAVPPERVVLRIVSAAWWLAIVVLMNAFSGQMRACLLVKNELEKINTLQDIAARPHLKVYVLRNTIFTRYLESSQGTVERKIWSMIRRDRSDLYGLLHFPEEMLLEILQEKAVVIHANSLSQSQAGKFCSTGEVGEFYFGTETMHTMVFGSYLSRRMNATLRQRIKRIMTAFIESGIFQHEYQQAIPPLDRCRLPDEKDDLTLGDTVSIFSVYAAFTAFSIAVFVAEMIVGYFTRPAGRSPRVLQGRRAAPM